MLSIQNVILSTLNLGALDIVVDLGDDARDVLGSLKVTRQLLKDDSDLPASLISLRLSIHSLLGCLASLFRVPSRWQHAEAIVNDGYLLTRPAVQRGHNFSRSLGFTHALLQTYSNSFFRGLGKIFQLQATFLRSSRLFSQSI